jgi:hypothetical protein
MSWSIGKTLSLPFKAPLAGLKAAKSLFKGGGDQGGSIGQYTEEPTQIAPVTSIQREGVRQAIARHFQPSQARLAQAATLRPGLRQAGVSAVPQATLEAARASALSGQLANLETQQQQQQFAADQARLQRLFGAWGMGYSAEQQRLAETTAQRRAYQNLLKAIPGQLLLSGGEAYLGSKFPQPQPNIYL